MIEERVQVCGAECGWEGRGRIKVPHTTWAGAFVYVCPACGCDYFSYKDITYASEE